MSELIDEVLTNSTYRDNARTLRKAIAEVDGLSVAAELVEQSLAQQGEGALVVLCPAATRRCSTGVANASGSRLAELGHQIVPFEEGTAARKELLPKEKSLRDGVTKLPQIVIALSTSCSMFKLSVQPVRCHGRERKSRGFPSAN